MSTNRQHLPDQEVATLGGGCFWCLQPIFEDINGVVRVVAGYSGGSLPNPTYQQVCSGTTGHAEVVQVTFDPKEISYREILEIFLAVHDPTTLNRQGADVGSQYRSVIFYRGDDQKQTAQRIVADVDAGGDWGGPAVTEVVPFEAFYRAEDYHQGYFAENPGQGYCRIVIEPKLLKFQQKYASRLKSAIGRP
jgi:peptide-methionine (S)-S-oxide reductase